MSRFARDERRALAEVLGRAGPDAPTLCEGWRTYDLAAHVVTRDRVPKAMPGLVVPPLHGVTERAERATRDAHSYDELVALVAAGPPRWHPTRLGPVDEAANVVEFAVHHEDVVRAAEGSPRRDLPAGLADALWSRLPTLGRLGLRRVPSGVVAERTDGPGRLVLRKGEPAVVLRGTPIDLVLFAFGRTDASGVRPDGDAESLAALAAARIGP